MDFLIADIVAIVVTAAGVVSAFSLLFSKFIKPVKAMVKQTEENGNCIKELDGKIEKIREEKTDEETQNDGVRAVLFQSLIAILDGLEQQGCNHGVTDQKKKLIKFISKGYKK
jgi:hypothetical protein